MIIRRNTSPSSDGQYKDFSQIKIGKKVLKDAIVEIPSITNNSMRKYSKEAVKRALRENDEVSLRSISNEFFRTSGIYARLVRYLAYLYRYDFLVTPYINEESDKVQKKKVLSVFYDILNMFDTFQVKKFLGETALKVVKNGIYYGYINVVDKSFSVQELPPEYCRVRYFIGSNPAVEFNLRYFDDKFKRVEQRYNILNLFPDEFKKAYLLYKENKLPPAEPGEAPGWYLLDINNTVRFNINGANTPILMAVIPAIIDLEDAQDLDRERMKQKLLKIIVQKMPLDKNGDSIFDQDEIIQFHENAVNMIGDNIGVDILTTFADVDVADMADKSNTNSVDDLEKVERTVFNEAGTSQMQFNTDGNIALQKSILNDEALMYNLIQQFETFLNLIICRFNKNKKLIFKAQMLTTTIYNYQELSNMYKEGMKIGFSKMLPQIALGISQSSILANAYFENDILDLINVFIPPLSSNVMNAEALAMTGNKTAAQVASGRENVGENQIGRPEKKDDEKSEKTIQNLESTS